MNLKFTDDELKIAMDKYYTNSVEESMRSMIRYLRLKQTEMPDGISGVDYLTAMYQGGEIDLCMFLKLRELVVNPHTEYTIKSE